MAGQKRSLTFKDSDLSRYQRTDDEINPESRLTTGLPSPVIAKVNDLATQQGLTLTGLIHDIILKHLETLESINQGYCKAEISGPALSAYPTKNPPRFVDPADLISIEEDFQELVS